MHKNQKAYTQQQNMITITQHKKYSNKVRFHWFAKGTIKKICLDLYSFGEGDMFLMPRLLIGPKWFEMKKKKHFLKICFSKIKPVNTKCTITFLTKIYQ